MRWLGTAPYVDVFEKATLDREIRQAGFVELSAPDVGAKPIVAFMAAEKPRWPRGVVRPRSLGRVRAPAPPDRVALAPSDGALLGLALIIGRIGGAVRPESAGGVPARAREPVDSGSLIALRSRR